MYDRLHCILCTSILLNWRMVFVCFCFFVWTQIQEYLCTSPIEYCIKQQPCNKFNLWEAYKFLFTPYLMLLHSLVLHVLR